MLTTALAQGQSIPHGLLYNCGCVVIIITVVVIILPNVSSLATPGTAQTLAHNNAVFTGGRKLCGTRTASFLLDREGPLKGIALLLLMPVFSPFSQQSGNQS
jgi:hypothetical protein